MPQTHNEDKSIAAERFIRTWRPKFTKKFTANDNKSYLGYLNKLVHEYNSYSRSTGKKPADADYFALTENIETNLRSPKFKVGDRVRITKYKNIFSKGYTENCKKSM